MGEQNKIKNIINNEIPFILKFLSCLRNSMKIIIARKKIIGWVLNMNPIPRRDAEIIILENLS
tara:strand:- start:91 stop:279 length:189 start_codon:yes stop_codon:yes gene_type:complete